LSPTGTGAAPAPPDQVQTVTCPDVGSLPVSLSRGVSTSPLPPGLDLNVSYQAVDTRTRATVSGGQPPGAIHCAAVPFTDLKAENVSPAPRPAGVASTDRLTGVWLVSVSVNVLPQPAAAASAAQSSGTFSFAGPLQSFLATRAGNASVAIFDSKSGVSFSTTPEIGYVTASIVKVDILATLLRQAQDAGRGLTPGEQATAASMIEFSDNNAATALWNQVGGAPAVARFNQLVGMPNTSPGPGGLWGLTITTASDQVRLMRVVGYPNAVLGDGQRNFMQSLMENVTPSQRWGVSGGIPAGVTIALKNGWLPRSGGWEINSIGHIAGGQNDYVIAALTSGDPSMGYGIGTIEVASSLVWAGLPLDQSGRLRVGTWYLRGELTSGTADGAFNYGARGDIPLVGDWNGDGVDGVAVVRNGVWYLRNELSSGVAEGSFAFGNPGDTPIVGDWNGGGGDLIGVVRNSVWYLRNSYSSGVADVSFALGQPGDVPVVGDFTGTGKDSIGVFRNGIWYLTTSLHGGNADMAIAFGNPGDIPVVGDWTGTGKDSIGVFRNGTWYLAGTLHSGVADITMNFGSPGDNPLGGVWAPSTASRPGVAR
jgi:hypothetical protein